MFGCERSFLQQPLDNGPRDINVLFVGSVHAAVQRKHLSWIRRLAQFAERWQVRICQGVFGKDYRQLLTRSRIVFNRSIRSEANKRAFEATAAGALLFQESENQEVSAYFRDRQECAYYTDRNLESCSNTTWRMKRSVWSSRMRVDVRRRNTVLRSFGSNI